VLNANISSNANALPINANQSNNMATNTTVNPIAITMGDPAGIGPEIIVKTLQDQSQNSTAALLVYGDEQVFAAQLKQLKSPLTLRVIQSPSEWRPDSNCLQLIATSRLAQPIQVGTISADYGQAATDAIKTATRDTLARKTAAIVTAPIHKEALSAAGVTFPGHTEMLAALAGGPAVRMMLANQELRTVLVTIHCSMRQAIDAITQSAVEQTIQITHDALVRSGIKNPRIAVAGLNPHAGEGGLFGREEIIAIGPAIENARRLGIDASGPYPGDTIFIKARHFKHFDVVIAMYHDQGLIPVKYLGIEEGVNVTLGLPFVRTSVDHGTAFDIAGKGIADHRSLVAAINMAQSLCSH
jgi:4-hydroxythreonine-4-phosphate dehydrogenase